MKKVSDLLTEQSKDNWFEQNVVGNAPTIMAVFANLVVIVADVRAYDVVYRLTESWWKALLASLACAIPFMLWEIAWQYNHTTDGWRKWSLVMAGFAFGTSLFLGVADYLNFSGTWSSVLLGGVVIATGIHTVMGFLYYYNDPDVARRRYKAQALGSMLDQELNAKVAKNLLENGEQVLSFLKTLSEQYDADEVEKIMGLLQGKKQDKPTQQKRQNQMTLRPARTFAAEEKQELDPTRPPRSNQ